MSKIFSFFLVAVSLVMFSAMPSLSQDPVAPASPLEVSMIALVANPQHFSGKRIRVIGYVDIEFESDAVYPHEEDFRDGMTKSGIWLRLSESEEARYKGLNRGLVILEGVFYANGPENGEYSGAIGKITRFERWEPIGIPDK